GSGGNLACLGEETHPPAALAASCKACLAPMLRPEDGCCGLSVSDPIGFALCDAASACMRAGGPPVGSCNVRGDTTTCFCGTNLATCDDPGQANGPCVAQMTAAAGRNVVTHTTDTPNAFAVRNRYSDQFYGLGHATYVQTLAAAFCPTECGF